MLVITSGTDGEHSNNSRHYVGLGIDLRTRYFDKGQQNAITIELRKRLGSEFSVVQHISHIHIQYNGLCI